VPIISPAICTVVVNIVLYFTLFLFGWFYLDYLQCHFFLRSPLTSIGSYHNIVFCKFADSNESESGNAVSGHYNYLIL